MKKKSWPQVLLFFAIIFFLRELLFSGKMFVTPGFGLGDQTLVAVPLAHYLSDSLKQGRFPLWTPEIFAGFPFAANGESGLFYPLNFILFYLFSPATALSLYALFTFLLMGFSTFYFLKSLKLSSQASLLAALSFTFASGMVARIIHQDILGTIAYLPLTFLLTQKFFEKRNPLLLIFLGFALSFQILNFNPQTTLLSLVGFSLYFLFKAYTSSKKKQLPLNLLALFFIYLLSLLLSAVQLVPGFQLLRLSERKTGVSLTTAAQFPFRPQELAYFLRPTPFGDPSLSNYHSPYPDPGIFWENNAYTGLVALGLGIFALIFLSAHKREVLFFSFLLIFSLLLALGKFTPLFFILRLPPFSFFRIPGRFVVLAMFSLSVLAAFGFEALTQKFLKKRSLLSLLLAAFILFDLFSFGLGYNPTYEAQKWLSPPKTAQILNEDKSFFRIYTIGDYEAYYTVYRQFQGWRQTIEPYFNLREALSPNLNLIWGLNHAEGYLGLPPQRFTDWQNVLKENVKIDPQAGTVQLTSLALKMLKMKNVKYIISAFKLPGQDFILKDDVSFGNNQPSYFIFELQNPLPHAFIVHQAKKLPDSQQVWEEFAQKSFDPQETVFLEESFTTLPEDFIHEGDEAEVVSYLPEKVIVKAKTKSPGFLVLTDAHLFGWQATVNNQPTRIYQADYLFRSVRLEPGEHEIIFTYQPSSLYLGAAISLSTLFLTFLFTVYLLLFPRHSKNTHPNRKI